MKCLVMSAVSLVLLILGIWTPSCFSYQVVQQDPPKKYKPVVIIHGVLESAAGLQDLQDMILKAHPETNVTAIDLYPDDQSLKPLWPQVHDFGEAMKPIMRDAGEDGINIICYSQGGVICRGILATVPDHNVKNFISLSAPLMGQFGDTSTFDFIPPDFRDEIYRFCYDRIGMNSFSVCQYWNDPEHQDLYKKTSTFLAVINNQTYNENSTAWKNNFQRIQNLVMIGGPDDGVITPWQSSHFGFFDANLTVIEMEQQEVYKGDYFGLKTLDERKVLHKCIMSDVIHIHWHSNQTVFDHCIEKWLD